MSWPGHGVATTGPRGKRERDSTRSRSSIESSTPPKHRGVPPRLCHLSMDLDAPWALGRIGIFAVVTNPRHPSLLRQPRGGLAGLGEALAVSSGSASCDRFVRRREGASGADYPPACSHCHPLWARPAGRVRLWWWRREIDVHHGFDGSCGIGGRPDLFQQGLCGVTHCNGGCRAQVAAESRLPQPALLGCRRVGCYERRSLSTVLRRQAGLFTEPPPMSARAG